MNAAPADESVGRLGRPRLRALLATIGKQTGLNVRDAELIKFTNNAVFRLPHAGVVVRIAGSFAVRRRVPKVVTVARWLAKHHVPAVRLVPDLPQPLTIDGELATLWHQVPRTGPPPTGTELGAILRQIHQLPPPPGLPAWNPFDSIRTRLADAEDLTDHDHAFLLTACDEVEAAIATVPFTLPPMLLHGDATVANLIPDRPDHLRLRQHQPRPRRMGPDTRRGRPPPLRQHHQQPRPARHQLRLRHHHLGRLPHPPPPPRTPTRHQRRTSATQQPRAPAAVAAPAGDIQEEGYGRPLGAVLTRGRQRSRCR